MNPQIRLFTTFGAASLAAVGAGAAVMASSGIGAGSWGRNLAAWLVGVLFALAVSRFARGRAAYPLLLIAALALAATLFAPGQSGVHRWVDIGPLHITVAALVLPSSLVVLAQLGIWSARALAFVLVAAAILIAQPDASQASAFLAGVAVLALRAEAPTAREALLAVFAVALGAAAWFRPDPLQPIAEVELIFSIAAAVSPPLLALAIVALAAACASPLVSPPRSEPGRVAAWALAVYFAVTAMAPALGAFPVPLVGLGMSFPVGFWLGIGLLATMQRADGNSRR